jgi:hypothetical protein
MHGYRDQPADASNIAGTLPKRHPQLIRCHNRVLTVSRFPGVRPAYLPFRSCPLSSQGPPVHMVSCITVASARRPAARPAPDLDNQTLR